MSILKTMLYILTLTLPLTSVKMAIMKNSDKSKGWQDVEKREPYTLLAGM
jgi:hypothetical protein